MIEIDISIFYYFNEDWLKIYFI